MQHIVLLWTVGIFFCFQILGEKHGTLLVLYTLKTILQTITSKKSKTYCWYQQSTVWSIGGVMWLQSDERKACWSSRLWCTSGKMRRRKKEEDGSPKTSCQKPLGQSPVENKSAFTSSMHCIFASQNQCKILLTLLVMCVMCLIRK